MAKTPAKTPAEDTPVEASVETAAPAITKSDARAAAWAQVVAKIKHDYPHAFEARAAAGEFDKIPDSFDPAHFKLD
ncbi:hypothetical protein [uncultured Reyranella sp.]|uniref:hypothetical protein n=1 Tax=uncultured Reyranella sp. TaxID=735512 RepID=UPI0025E0805D|nr:hypothetical protein [uncultured Reyranella sp.]